MHKLIKYAVPLLLITAFLAAVMWAVCAPDFEPTITSLALLASLIAVYADRWMNIRERRKELLGVLAHELYMNIGVVKDLSAAKNVENISKPHIYPRFYTTSLTSVIASGMFARPKDKKLWKCMHGWLQRSTDFNNRLNVTESQIFSNPANAEAFNKKITEGKAATITIAKFKELMNILMTNYKAESEIDYDTVFFEEE